MRSPARKRREIEGAAALELALVLPLFTLLLLGSVDFGHLFFVKSVITNAAREEARYRAVQATASARDAAGISTTTTNVLTAANLYGANCRMDCATVSTSYDAANSNVVVTVTVSGTFQNISRFGYGVLPGFGNPFSSITNLKAKSEMRWESAP
jgi:Flp pilus assembly protein TadG